MSDDRMILAILFVLVVLFTEYANVTSLYSRIFKKDTIWDDLCHGLLNLWWGFSVVGIFVITVTGTFVTLVLLFKYFTTIV